MKKIITTFCIVCGYILVGLILPGMMAGVDFSAITTFASSGNDNSVQYQPGTDTFLQQGWDIYQNPDYGFEIFYPIGFSQKTLFSGEALNSGLNLPGDTPVWKFSLDPVYFTGTNLLEVSLVINVLPSAEEAAACLEGKSQGISLNSGKALPEIKINGITFTQDVVKEGVMGETYQKFSYRTVSNNACYEITELIHARNIDAFVSNTINLFSQEEVLAQLHQVRDSFRFLEVKPTFPVQKVPELTADLVNKTIDKVGDEHVHGLDVSHWQGTIRWGKVAGAGYDFTFVKSTEGTGWTDSQFLRNITSGSANGIYMGVYHFARPDLGNTGQEEAEYFLSVVGDYLESGYLRPVLDLEVTGSMGKTELSKWVLEWMQTVENQSGVAPLIYTNLYYINTYLTSAVTAYDIWIAYWNCDPSPTFNIPPTGQWSDWGFWQYCVGNAGTVPGITTRIDLNIFNGVEEGLSAYDAASPLWVSLTNYTNAGPAPHYADLTADVNGDAVGTINYALWWDCPALGIDLETVSTQCGDLPDPDPESCLSNENGMRCLEIAEEIVIAEHTYQEIGDYTAKVIVERDAAPPAEDRYRISAYNPITDIVITPPSPGAGTVNNPYQMNVEVRIETSIEGALQFEIIEDSSGEIQDQSCREVPANSRLQENFAIELIHPELGSENYTIWLRYRSGEYCSILDERDTDSVRSYEVGWGIPEMGLKRLDGSELVNHSVDILGDMHAILDNSLTYQVVNHSPITPLSVTQIEYTGLDNVIILDSPISLTVAPATQTSLEILYQVISPGPFQFDLTLTHTDESLSPFTISVGGRGISPFVDLEIDYWAYEAIEEIRLAGLTSGCAENPLRYCPEDPVLRAQMAIFLLKGVGVTPLASDGSHPFTDIAGHWAETWIEELFDTGMTGGYPDGTYRPENQITRAETAVFLLKGKHGNSYSPPAASGGAFTDVSGHWAEAWIEQLAAEGIASGYPDGTFAPDQTVTRAEMAVLRSNRWIRIDKPDLQMCMIYLPDRICCNTAKLLL